MLIVTVNSGSTSVKLAAYEAGDAGRPARVAEQHCSGESLEPVRVLSGFLSGLNIRPSAIAHRVVHGGTRFTGPVRLNDAVLAEIRKLSELAPLHNPKALEWIEAARRATDAQMTQVAAFDTSFFSALPRVAAEYALPPHLGVDKGVRRYGFHGLAHEAMWLRWCELNPELPAGGNILTLQLGGGCSACAIAGGKPLDTTMGFSPLEGLVMATRSGDVDPSVVPYLQKRLERSPDEVISSLNRECGVAGMAAGETDLGKLAADPAPEAQHAVQLYCYRVRKCIGAYLVVLGRCDGIVFGGGVGEHVPAVRERILSGMEWLGLALEAEANRSAIGKEARISASRAPIPVLVIPVDEEGVLVEAARKVL